MTDLLEAIAEVLTSEWRKYAACIEDEPSQPNIFFEEEYFEEARKICMTCSVRVECLDNAIKYSDDGFRGGLSPKERNSVVMHRRRQHAAFRHDLKSAGLDFE